jgi:hypothetical protein
MLEVARFVGPKYVYILGDYADFYSVSSHAKDPRVFGMLTDEVCDVLMGLDQLDQIFPGAKKVYIEGNHEYRLERYLTNQAPALFGTTSTQHVLELHDRPLWNFIPYGPDQLTSVAGSCLFARHEPLGNNAKLTATKALCSITYGHIHRIEESHIVGLDGSNHVAFSVGWLGDKRKDQVFNYVKGYWQWQMGFGIIYVDPKSRMFYHNKIHILETNKKLSCFFNGKLFTN